MATLEQCQEALGDLAARLAGSDDSGRRRGSLDRTLACVVSDLATVFTGRLVDGELRDVTLGGSARGAQITLTVSSDDLVALTGGQLGFAGAWASGRLRIEASMMDLIRLRNLL